MFEHEHVTLISNVAENEGDKPPSLNKFRTKLASPLSLDPDTCDIGLEAIAFNYDWYNLQNDAILKLLNIQDKSVVRIAKVPCDHYDSLDLLVAAVNKALDYLYVDQNDPSVRRMKISVLKASRTLVLDGSATYMKTDPPNSKIRTTCATVPCSRDVELEIPDGLKNMMGFYDFKTFSKENGILKSFQGKNYYSWIGGEVDMKNGIHQVCVYSNIIRHRRVGNHLSQLLRVVQLNSEAKFDSRISYSFNPIQYFSPRLRDITEIEIEVRDDAGVLIPFRRGRTTVELDIRRRL